MDHIVVDVEIKRSVETLPGKWNATDQMGVACAVVYSYQTDSYSVFGDSESDLSMLRARILRAHRVTGFNTFNFDFAVIWKSERNAWIYNAEMLRAQLAKRSDDILRRIWVAKSLDPDNFVPQTHGGFKLDDLVKTTLGEKGKIGHGAQAPIWYQNGEYARVVNYCIDDVRLERNLGEFVDKYGYVIDPNSNTKLEIPKWIPQV